MLNWRIWLACITTVSLLTACDRQTSEDVAGRSATNIATHYKTLDWTDLMPAGDLEALLNPPAYISEITEGAVGDKPAGLLKSAIAKPKDRYQQALTSSNVRKELDGSDIRIAGYLVPVDYNEKQQATTLFAVPFFGACLHLPPPPPNQIILINSEQGVEIEDMYTPYWLTGTLNTDLQENDVAESAYSMALQGYELYAEPY